MKYLLIFIIGALVGYYVKDNLAIPDQEITNNNKIKQKGEGNILKFVSNIFRRKNKKR